MWVNGMYPGSGVARGRSARRKEHPGEPGGSIPAPEGAAAEGEAIPDGAAGPATVPGRVYQLKVCEYFTMTLRPADHGSRGSNPRSRSKFSPSLYTIQRSVPSRKW